MVDKYICPKCGSDNWKMVNAVSPAKTCKDCGYTGIFLIKEKLK